MLSNAKILIVEDQVIIATNLKVLLKHHQYDVVGIAANSDQVFDSISKNQPDLILMDISLPGKHDGIEITNIIREKYDIPVIYLTSSKDIEIIERAKLTGAYSYIMKDATLKDQLPVMIEFVLYKHKIELDLRRERIDIVESEEKFRQIATSAKDAIFFIDYDGTISFWNRSATEIFGFTEKEVLGKQLHELIAPEEYRDFYERGFSFNNSDEKIDILGKTLEMQAFRKDGSIIPIEISLSSVTLKGKQCACGIIRDITLRKTSEEQMERLIEELQISRDVIEQQVNDLIILNEKIADSEEKLRETNASKDKFFSIIAHDLKNPFQGLLGYSEILAKDLLNMDTEDVQEVAHDLHESAQNLFKLLENLLQWSRIQRGVIEYNPDVFSLHQVAQLNVGLVNSSAFQKRITIENQVDPELMVYADVNMINTIIRNLLTNACKFTDFDGRIVLTGTKISDQFAEVGIIDNGVGINQENCDKLFRIDSQLTTLGTANEKGTGLGLVLCKELTEKNGGEIRVESTIGEGTAFYFSIPLPSEEMTADCFDEDE